MRWWTGHTFVKVPDGGADECPKPVRILNAEGELIRMHYPEVAQEVPRCRNHGRVSCPACTTLMGKQTVNPKNPHTRPAWAGNRKKTDAT